MPRSAVLLVGLVIGLLAAGCGGPALLKAKGRVLKGGTPFLPAQDEAVRVMFVPVPEGGERVSDYYMATYNREDGTFQAAGKDGRGLPPGKYRIAVEHVRDKRDLLKGAFDADHSPFVREVTS